MQNTFASVVSIIGLLMVDSGLVTPTKLETKAYSSASKIFNVMDYGALSGGLNDDRPVNIFHSVL